MNTFLVIAAIAWASVDSSIQNSLVLLEPPPIGYYYRIPQPISVGGEVYWIANLLEKEKPNLIEYLLDRPAQSGGSLAGLISLGIGIWKGVVYLKKKRENET